jgi:N-acetylmuramoyl-L-alanine amidase
MKKFLMWLLGLFKADTQKPVVTIPNSPEAPDSSNTKSEIKKVALIVGHGNGDPGAQSKNKKINEFDYNSEVAKYVSESKDHGKIVKVFYRGKSGIVGVALEAVAWGADLSVELHLNSFNSIAQGCEVLVLKGDNASAEIGRSFAKSFTETFKRMLRREKGINWISGSDRGGASLKAVSPIKRSILVEPLFVDNDAEYLEPKRYADWFIGWLKSI